MLDTSNGGPIGPSYRDEDDDLEEEAEAVSLNSIEYQEPEPVNEQDKLANEIMQFLDFEGLVDGDLDFIIGQVLDRS